MGFLKSMGSNCALQIANSRELPFIPFKKPCTARRPHSRKRIRFGSFVFWWVLGLFLWATSALCETLAHNIVYKHKVKWKTFYAAFKLHIIKSTKWILVQADWANDLRQIERMISLNVVHSMSFWFPLSQGVFTRKLTSASSAEIKKIGHP